MFYSENNSIAKIDGNGLITAISNGSTKIYVASSNGVNVECEVNVHTTPQKLLLNKSEIDLFVNGVSGYKLKSSFEPKTSNYKTNITYTSSNDDVASVDENGLIRGISSGNATITATSENELTASCDVSVKTLPSKLTIDENVALENGSEKKLNCSISPENADTDTDITWKSDNENIVIVSEDGTITGVGAGKTTVTARTENGKTAKCEVTVYNQIKDFSFSIDTEKPIMMDLSKSETLRIFANSNLGEDITSALTWEVEHPEIATIEGGLITGLSIGETTITGKINGIEKTFSLEVHRSPLNFKIEKSIVTLDVNGQEKLEYTIEPEETDINNSVEWVSSDEDIVEIDDGNITAKKVGKATIMATCNNIVSTCRVMVKDENSKMNFEKSQLIVQNENSETVSLVFDETLTGDSIDINDLNITCDSEEIVSLQYEKELNGGNEIEVTVTGQQSGFTTIMASFNDMVAYCEVVVYNDLSGLDLYYNENKQNNETMTCDLSRNTHTFTIEAKINDIENNINNVVTWNSSEKEVARVNKNGEITVLKNGETTISAQLNELKAEFTLKVITSPTGITGIPSEGNLWINGLDSIKLKPKVIPDDINVDYNFKYESSESSVAEVSEDGTITAHSNGNTIITVKVEGEQVKDGITAKCNLCVRTQPKEVKIGETSEYLQLNSNRKLQATIDPYDANDSNIISWSSTSPNIVKVDNYGNIQAVNIGTATITAKTPNDKTASIDIKVPNLVANVNVSSLDLSGTKVTKISTQGSSNVGTINYENLSPDVVSVSSDGQVTAKANGTANIRVTESNASTQKTIFFPVVTTTQSIALNTAAANLHIYNTNITLTATQSPPTISTKGVTWNSSNPSAATVNANGVVSRVAPGTSTITATAIDGSGKVASCTITVQPEKLMIVGASTVVQLANERTCAKGKTAAEANAGINYATYGYTKGTDLFFVCIGGSGYHWMTGNHPGGQFKNDSEKISNYGSTGIKKIESILNNNKNSHFTMIFMQGGNDLSKAISNNKDDGSKVDSMATTYYNWYVQLADTYQQHTVYVFPVSPVDVSMAGGDLKKKAFNVSDSNNRKRYRFATKLNDLINNSGNLKYAAGAFNELNRLQESGEYVCYDGKHFNQNTARLVFEEMLKYTGCNK